MTPGFIGTGTITSALVTGLCTSAHPPASIWVSPRNAHKAGHLEAAFQAVRIGTDNQEVVDRTDVVVLAVLPQQAEAILGPLRFRADQPIVSLLAGTPLSRIRSLVAPADPAIRAVPLPSTEKHVGPIALFPGNATAEALLQDLGTLIVAQEEPELDKLSIITSLMAPYYALLHEIVTWAADAGVDPKNAADYTASMFRGLSFLVEDRKDTDLATMVQECMTPGGLNEAALEVIRTQGGFAPITEALCAVRNKVEGDS